VEGKKRIFQTREKPPISICEKKKSTPYWGHLKDRPVNRGEKIIGTVLQGKKVQQKRVGKAEENEIKKKRHGHSNLGCKKNSVEGKFEKGENLHNDTEGQRGQAVRKGKKNGT